MKICNKCKTEIKCRDNPEHKALCFYPSCECGECEEDNSQSTSKEKQ